MENDEITGNANPDQKPAESDNLTADAFFAQLLPQAETTPEPEEETEETEEEEADEVESTEEEPEETESEEAIDFESLTAEQWEEIGSKIKSKAAKRIAELTRRAKTAEEELQRTQQGQKPADPLQTSSAKVENEVIAKVSTVEELKHQKELAEALEEWAQDILDLKGDYSETDIVVSYQGKDYTKKEILERRNLARRLLKKDIPTRLEELQEGEAIKRQTEINRTEAVRIVPEIADEKSQVAAVYSQFMGSPILKDAIAKTPKLEAEAVVIMALAARAVADLQAKAKKPAPTKGALPKPKAPAPPPTGGSAPSRPADKAKKVQESMRQFEQSGSPDDFANALVARLF